MLANIALRCSQVAVELAASFAVTHGSSRVPGGWSPSFAAISRSALRFESPARVREPRLVTVAPGYCASGLEVFVSDRARPASGTSRSEPWLRSKFRKASYSLGPLSKPRDAFASVRLHPEVRAERISNRSRQAITARFFVLRGSAGQSTSGMKNLQPHRRSDAAEKAIRMMILVAASSSMFSGNQLVTSMPRWRPIWAELLDLVELAAEVRGAGISASVFWIRSPM